MSHRRARARLAATLLAGLITVAYGGTAAHAAEDPGTPGGPVDPTTEAQNYSKVHERSAIYDTPAYQAALAQASAANAAEAASIQAADPGRAFAADLCANGMNGCAGDVRLDDWAAKGYGIVSPVLFTARSGATLSGHVWATKAGPAKRPGIVITNGSVQADEKFYWFVAQALAKDGYVVLTFDPQGQGQSDTPGAGADDMEGVPAQKDGRPFYDGTEDAIDFFTSTPTAAFEPRPSCNSGTSHADKQDSRVASGLDSAFNPYWSMLDTSRIGLVGHSYGAGGVSYIAQFDPRVSAVVAYDNLDPPMSTGGEGGELGCVDATQRATPPVSKPGLGLAGDYGLPPTPNETVPAIESKSAESLAYTAAGVDSGEILIRGGTHLDFDFIPNDALPATLRGADLITWYTDAWMDKFVKHDPTADTRLLSTRWRTDTVEQAVDPNSDANDFSFYLRSRLDVHRSDGTVVDCEDLRTGCAGQPVDDGVGPFDYLSYDTTPDAVSATPPATLPEAPWAPLLPVGGLLLGTGLVLRRRHRATFTGTC